MKFKDYLLIPRLQEKDWGLEFVHAWWFEFLKKMWNKFVFLKNGIGGI
jgi:hypothetical protein